MKYRELDRENNQVVRLGLGLAALGRPGYINLGHAEDLQSDYDVDSMQRHAFTVLDAAWEAGIRYFDAARSYGKAEVFLGSWLEERNIESDAVTVGSKWGYEYTANWQIEAEVHEQKQHSYDRLSTQWQESQENLGPFLDLYQIHSATLESGVLTQSDVLKELARLKQQGTAIGLSVSGPNQRDVIEQAMQIQVDGVDLFDVVQATWNVLERSAETALIAAHDKGMGVIIKESLANGRLTNRNQSKEFQQSLACLQQEADRLNTTVDALSLAAVLDHPWADIVLSGAAGVDQLQSNLDSLNVNFDDQARSRLQELTEPSTQYWQTRSQLQWN